MGTILRMSCVELEDALNELDKRLQELDDADTLCIDELETDEINEAVEVSSDLRQAARRIRSKLVLKIKFINSPKDDVMSEPAEPGSSTSSFSKLNVRLPKLSLPKFNGWFQSVSKRLKRQ